MIKTITSFSNPFIKMLRSLDLKKNRDAQGVFLAEGMRHVKEAVANAWNVRTIIFHSGDRMIDQIEHLQAELPKTEFIEVTKDVLSKITHRENAETIIALIEQKYEDLISIKSGVWVVLEEVRDPGNLGTIMRTCDAVGAQGVVLVGQCCDAFSPEAVRATMGSFATIQVVKSNITEFLRWRQSWQGEVIGTHLKGAVDYRACSYKKPLLLVMGNEQKGLSDEMSGACSQLVKMPMRGSADSLNLAVATGVMLYEINRLL